MRHVFRGYSSTALALRTGGSVIASIAFLTSTFGGAALTGALGGTAILAIAAQGLSLVPGRITIGEDGVELRWLWRRVFLPRHLLASVELKGKARLIIATKEGSSHRFEVARKASVGPVRGHLAQLIATAEGAEKEGAVATASAAHEALTARAAAWVGGGMNAPSTVETYRGGESRDHLWESAEDVDAPALARIGAILALGALDEDERARVRHLAESSANPLLIDAVAAALGDPGANVRRAKGAMADAARGAAAPRPGTGRAPGAEHVPALMHPQKALLGLSFLSRLWFVLPPIALFTHSPSLSILAAIASLVGPMPWVGVREYDPLVRAEPGDVGWDGGFLTRDGERVLDLAHVRHAVMHHRPGAPPVVRLIGRFGWPLLDVRMKSREAARELLRTLPLGEERKTPRYSTMLPGRSGKLALGALAMLALAGVLAALAGLRDTNLLVAVAGLPLAAMRLPRWISVLPHGLLIETLGRKRLVRYDEMDRVERRTGAGVVVLKNGERLPLRSVTGELTDVPDDDLTEAVIDGFEDFEAAKTATRVRVGEVETLDGPVTAEDAEEEPVSSPGARTPGRPTRSRGATT